ncbi:MAG: hypothetical protein RLZZ31_2027 [Actinomycetota bacterium]
MVMATRRRILICLGLYVLVGSLTFHALSGLQFKSGGSQLTGVVMRLPSVNEHDVTVDIRTRIGRIELRGSKKQLASFDVGQDVRVTGELRPISNRRDVRARHLRASIAVETVERAGRQWWSIGPSAIRTLVTKSAQPLGRDYGLYLGFVIGDERGITKDMSQTFQASGMSHLLVVSGQNLAFIIVLASPILSRLRRGSRFLFIFFVVTFFVTLTGFEPSVLRAAVMVMVGAVGLFTESLVTGMQRVAIAFILCLLLDPLLVYSRGFQLSVSATLGIVLLSHFFVDRLKGPLALRQVMAITIAAQIGVAPFSLLYFGSIPTVSVLTNTLCEPVAGFVMMWGSSAGVVAGLFPSFLRYLVQLPMLLCLWWLRWVAEVGARLPFPRLGVTEMGLAVLAIGLFSIFNVLRRRLKVMAG